MSTTRTQIYLCQLYLSKALVQQQLDGLSDEDLLRQPDSRGNCANWILGHIINSRNICLQYMQDDAIWDEATQQLYQGGSAPITGNDSPHLSRAELMHAYIQSDETLVSHIERLTDEALDGLVDDEATLADKISFVTWHEAYHTGQFEYLRQLTGVDDAVP